MAAAQASAPADPDQASSVSDQTTARRQFGSTAAATGYAVLYEGSGPLARFFNARITLISEELAACMRAICSTSAVGLG